MAGSLDAKQDYTEILNPSEFIAGFHGVILDQDGFPIAWGLTLYSL
jgi:hypothetical protein